MNSASTEYIQRYLSAFQSFEKTLNGESKTPLHGMRKAAMNRLAEIGFPTNKNEEWKFTSVLPIIREQFYPSTVLPEISAQKTDLSKFLIPHLDGPRLVFVNGHFSKDLSLIPSSGQLQVASLAMALKSAHGEKVFQHLGKYASSEQNAFTALNTGFLQDGACIVVPDNTKIDTPVYLLYLSTGGESLPLVQPRNLILAGKNSGVTVVMQYTGLSQQMYFMNAVSEIVAGENAVVELTKLQQENNNAFHIDSAYIHQDAGSNVKAHSVSFGGAIVRNNITTVLDAEGCECTLNGLSLGTGTQHIDNHTVIDHAKPRCNSHELYKSILSGKSKGVFNGKIFVRKDAQKTDAKQTNKTLLLSDDATMNTKPQLEIFADDVKCTHGATVGYLDAEALFYLRSRAIGLDDAQDMLTRAFASDVTERNSIESLREYLNSMLIERLEKSRT